MYIARHGETELNRLGVVQGSGVDPGLNEFGEAQARALYEAIGGAVELVVTSNLQRAVETAAPFAAAGIPTRVDARFREIAWGEHDGKVAEPWMRDEYAKLMAAWEAGSLNSALPGGESAAALGARLRAAWQEFATADFGVAAIVMHGRALRALACVIDGQPLARMNDYPHSNGGYYVATRDDTGAWGLRERNHTDHLRDIATQNETA